MTTKKKENAAPAVGERSRTTEGSHELVSYGNGTARERPIVDADGNYPARPDADDSKADDK